MQPKTYHNFLELLSSRRSTHKFTPDPVLPDILEKLARAFNLAPAVGDDHSAGCLFITESTQITAINSLVQKILVEKLELLESTLTREDLLFQEDCFQWLGQVPALAFISAKITPSYLKESLGDGADTFFGRFLSASMAAQNLILAAESLSLGTSLISVPLAFSQELESFLGIEKSHRLIAIIAMGWKLKK